MEAPPNLKSIQPYLKIANEHDQRDVVVAYWSRVYVLQNAIKLAKQPDEKAFLLQIMDWLENFKKSHKDNELVTNDTVAQAYLENYAFKLFDFADKRDRSGDFNKSVVKAFYTSSMIYDIICVFGDLSEEAKQNQKYGKWKATYIHNCLKNGETPHAGPLPSEEDDLFNEGAGPTSGAPSSSFGWNTNPSDSLPPPASSTQPPPVSSPSNPNNDPFMHQRPPSPPKDPEEKNPGGFVPYDPNQSNIPTTFDSNKSSSSVTPELMMKAQKYCKFAGSALTYEDIPTAIENLQKALRVLTTGQDS